MHPLLNNRLIQREETTSKSPTLLISLALLINFFLREFQKHSMNQRKKSLDDMHSQLKKYLNRMPAALVRFYSNFMTYPADSLSCLLSLLKLWLAFVIPTPQSMTC